MKSKYEECYKGLAYKNRHIQELNGKIKYYENQTMEKCHEHTLIIDSLSTFLIIKKRLSKANLSKLQNWKEILIKIQSQIGLCPFNRIHFKII